MTPDGSASAPQAAGGAAAQLVELTKATGGLAHEVRNPLSTLRVNLQLLAEEWRALADRDVSPSELAAVCRRSTQRLGTLLKEVDRVVQILDGYLGFVGKDRPALADVDLRVVIQELAEFFEPQARAAGMRLDVRLPDDPLVCPLDEGLVRQALLNLFMNARQAMPGGGTLIVSVTDQGAWARIELIDTGCGMAPDVCRRVFEPYFTTRPGGTGLGLATTRRIVLLHGGRIEVDSEPGVGTRFRLDFPRTTERAAR